MAVDRNPPDGTSLISTAKAEYRCRHYVDITAPKKPQNAKIMTTNISKSLVLNVFLVWGVEGMRMPTIGLCMVDDILQGVIIGG